MKQVTCYGTGLIGSAWGAVFLRGGCDVTFYDIDQEKLDGAKAHLEDIFAFFRSSGLMNEQACSEVLTHAHFTCDAAQAVSQAEFIQENCPERIELKRKVLALIEANCAPDTIIASSTSGLLISDIAAEAVYPERVIGGHPYNPVYLMPLVEISKGDRTSDEAVARAKAFYTAMNKEPVVMNKECPGFLCNRIQMAVVREAFDLVYRGVCSVEDIDKAVTYGLGLRWGVVGPHMVLQLNGGAGGLRGVIQHLGPGASVWLKDMATWTEIPKDYVDRCGESGVTEEMAHRTPGQGQDNAELDAYMRGGILALLKYHGKI